MGVVVRREDESRVRAEPATAREQAAPGGAPAGAPAWRTAALMWRYAAGFLGLAVLVGGWLRAAMAWPRWGLGANLRFAVHAHSHVAFFGWVVLAVTGAMTLAARPGAARARTLARVTHGVAAASLLVFVAFLRGGYDATAIALSTVHVALWIALAALLWRPLRAPGAPVGAEVGAPAGAPARAHLRAALVFLVLAGVSTLGPGIALARGATDPWLRELAVKLFLGLFIGGFVWLAAMGVARERLHRQRFARAALALVAAGVVPSVLLHPAPPPPAGALLVVGRVGSLLVGAGTLLFAADLLAARTRSPLLLLAGVAALVKGALELLAGAGVGLALVHSQPVVIAYLHLVLLGAVTPIFLAAMSVGGRPWRRVVAYSAGLATMLLALVALGWPAAYRVASAAGIDAIGLLKLASLGGALCVVSAMMLLPWARRTDALAGASGAVSSR